MTLVVLLFQSIGISRLLLILLLLAFSPDLADLASRSPKFFLFLAVNLLILSLLIATPSLRGSPGTIPSEEFESQRAIVVRDPMIVAHVNSADGSSNADVFFISSPAFYCDNVSPLTPHPTRDHHGREELCYNPGKEDDGAHDDSLALITTEVVFPVENRQICKAIVPFHQEIAEDPPRTTKTKKTTKKSTIKKRKVAAAIPKLLEEHQDHKQLAQVSDQVISSNGELGMATTVDVARLSSCSIEDFNEACSTIIKLRRQEWQIR
ncbi:hypothetical protein SELMODRAFT_426992 [Selaginella moellendorffii]|uniref:DUF4408 domain-containing protein n=1 Tax=Selaginella moellendorffii TaxID=88036 RepID=D8SY61_SELML|nr:hypothetical protein SELMODRAFT_426992 [Selaginella moellendorffii]